MKSSHNNNIISSFIGHEYMLEMAMFNVERAITPKVGKQELWFMCSARCLIGFTFVWSFFKTSKTVFNLHSGHE